MYLEIYTFIGEELVIELTNLERGTPPLHAQGPPKADFWLSPPN
jgi:hypothetical protein